jgi:hypothetical protein
LINFLGINWRFILCFQSLIWVKYKFINLYFHSFL